MPTNTELATTAGWPMQTIMSMLEVRDEKIAALNAKVEADRDLMMSMLAGQRELVISLIEAQTNATTHALASSNLAVEKAEKSINEWKVAMNEWRGTISDRDKNFATKESVEDLKTWKAKQEGHGAGVTSVGTIVVGIIGSIGVLVSIGTALYVAFRGH